MERRTALKLIGLAPILPKVPWKALLPPPSPCTQVFVPDVIRDHINKGTQKALDWLVKQKMKEVRTMASYPWGSVLPYE